MSVGRILWSQIILLILENLSILILLITILSIIKLYINNSST